MHMVALQDENLADPKLVHGMICMHFKEKLRNRNTKKEQSLICVQ